MSSGDAINKLYIKIVINIKIIFFFAYQIAQVVQREMSQVSHESLYTRIISSRLVESLFTVDVDER